MRINICPKGHKYDEAFFMECPHCLKNNIHTDAKSEPKKSPAKKKVITDQIIQKEIKDATKRIEISEHKEEKPAEKKPLPPLGSLVSFVAMASVPIKITKNQEFTFDFALFESNLWRDGADMLSFKLQNGARDIKNIQLSLEMDCEIKVFYKEDVLWEDKVSIDKIKNRILTHCITISDTRDRRLHMIHIIIKNEEYNIEETLLLQPTL